MNRVAIALVFLTALLLVEAQASPIQSQHIAVLKKHKATAAAGDIVTGLIGQWLLEEGTGTSADDTSTNSNVGTLAGATVPPTWITGKVGAWALNFGPAADDERVGMGDVLDVTPTTSFTLSAWSRPDATTASKFIVSKKTASGINSAGYAMFWSTTEDITCNYSDSVGVNAAGPLTSDTLWHHVVMVVNRTTQLMTCYADNVAGTSVDISARTGASISNAAPLQIGTVGAGFELSMQGDIDDVFIFDRALAPADICELFKRGGGSC